MTEWINCEERLPPNSVYVLIARFDTRPKVKMYFIQISCRYNKQWQDDRDGEIIDPKYGTVTHWMPLPDAPGIL
jgi:hypothetical protein